MPIVARQNCNVIPGLRGMFQTRKRIAQLTNEVTKEIFKGVREKRIKHQSRSFLKLINVYYMPNTSDELDLEMPPSSIIYLDESNHVSRVKIAYYG